MALSASFHEASMVKPASISVTPSAISCCICSSSVSCGRLTRMLLAVVRMSVGMPLR
ncbi:hypothetical protein D3C72_2592050 [compost metagenome]